MPDMKHYRYYEDIDFDSHAFYHLSLVHPLKRYIGHSLRFSLHIFDMESKVLQKTNIQEGMNQIGRKCDQASYLSK